jgi:hypothetical protein
VAAEHGALDDRGDLPLWRQRERVVEAPDDRAADAVRGADRGRRGGPDGVLVGWIRPDERDPPGSDARIADHVEHDARAGGALRLAALDEPGEHAAEKAVEPSRDGGECAVERHGEQLGLDALGCGAVDVDLHPGSSKI